MARNPGSFNTDRLEHLTGHHTTYWLARVESLIRACEREPTDEERKQLTDAGYSPDHKFGSSPLMWMTAVFREVEQCRPVSVHDGNMWSAAVMGAILTSWFLRLCRVKSYDESRPLADRMPSYETYLWHLHSLMLQSVDERDDALVFPHITKRVNPFSPDAKSGTFR
jgi:hypothetical protein